MCDPAVTAYLKGGHVKKAIDCCIVLNEWDVAVDLAQEYDYAQAQTVSTLRERTGDTLIRDCQEIVSA